jgi:hypothetical protein
MTFAHFEVIELEMFLILRLKFKIQFDCCTHHSQWPKTVEFFLNNKII